MVTHHIIVTGRVQGVFFRATAKKTAITLGLAGWVRNTENGDVELLVSGKEEKLEEFEQWCKVGPPQAVVKDVIISIEKVRHYDDFKILK